MDKAVCEGLAMMPPTKASMRCTSRGIRNGLTTSKASSAPTGSDRPCMHDHCSGKQHIPNYAS